MNFNEIRSMEDSHLFRVYSRKQVAIIRGNGANLYDDTGREYVDCAGGYGTCIVGHAHPKVARAVSQQAAQLMSCHMSTYNDSRAVFLEKLFSITPVGLDRAYLGNSGADAVECAIKIARKSTGRRKIVAVKGGYHGKTHGALSATWDAKYRKSFEPLLPDFSHVPFGDVEAAKESVSRETAALLVEPIQGEGGVRVPPPDWLPILRDITRDTGTLLIADEVQTGVGRTGKMFACEHSNVTPDVLCLGKGVASGLPIGVTIAGENLAGSLSLGEHTSTFGGNPVVCAAGAATIDVLIEDHLLENASTTGAYLRDGLTTLLRNTRVVREVRGLGLMLGMEMRFDVLQILQACLQSGLLLLDAGRNVLRFLPPLCIRRDQIDTVLSVLRGALEEEELARLPS
jgi:acetylornithine/LysW-gamma-L-lysine aminotransferase